VLIGVGSGLSISGLIAFIYFRQNPWVPLNIERYRGITLPLLIAGICIIALGIVTFYQARQKRRYEKVEISPVYLPPPPPPPPSPPPPK